MSDRERENVTLSCIVYLLHSVELIERRNFSEKKLNFRGIFQKVCVLIQEATLNIS